MKKHHPIHNLGEYAHPAKSTAAGGKSGANYAGALKPQTGNHNPKLIHGSHKGKTHGRHAK